MIGEELPPLNPADDDQRWMTRALELGAEAAAAGEVPVGAVVVLEGKLIGEGWNQPVASHDPSAHAEIVALRAAARAIGNYRLSSASLYVTIEPCAMCAGALVHARVARLVFAAREPRAGAVISNLGLLERGFLNHRVAWSEGVCEQAAAQLMKDFFARRRASASGSFG